MTLDPVKFRELVEADNVPGQSCTLRLYPGDPQSDLADFLLSHASELLALVEADGWRTMESAPKGNGDQFESVTDPGYIAPPEILMLFEDGSQCVVRWDWYYAPGGYGHAHAQGGPAWVAVAGGELAHLHFGSPTHWRPLPKEPAQ